MQTAKTRLRRASTPLSLYRTLQTFTPKRSILPLLRVRREPDRNELERSLRHHSCRNQSPRKERSECRFRASHRRRRKRNELHCIFFTERGKRERTLRVASFDSIRFSQEASRMNYREMTLKDVARVLHGLHKLLPEGFEFLHGQSECERLGGAWRVSA